MPARFTGKRVAATGRSGARAVACRLPPNSTSGRGGPPAPPNSPPTPTIPHRRRGPAPPSPIRRRPRSSAAPGASSATPCRTPRRPRSPKRGGITLNSSTPTSATSPRRCSGDFLNVNYTIGAGVAGTITVQTSKPLARSEILRCSSRSCAWNGARGRQEQRRLQDRAQRRRAARSHGACRRRLVRRRGRLRLADRAAALRLGRRGCSACSKACSRRRPSCMPMSGATCSSSRARSRNAPPSSTRSRCSTSTGWPGCRSGCSRRNTPTPAASPGS